MKGKTHRKTIRVLAAVMIGVMGCILMNNALFTHAHVLPDGTVAAHAHPIVPDQNAEKGLSHTHTSVQMFHMDHLIIFFLCLATALMLGSVPTESVLPFQPFRLRSLLPLPGYHGRAPPCWL